MVSPSGSVLAVQTTVARTWAHDFWREYQAAGHMFRAVPEWLRDESGRLYRFSREHQDEIEQILTGDRGRGYDKDRLRAALRQLTEGI